MSFNADPSVISPSDPGLRYRTVTPDDNEDLPDGACRAINVSADCTLTILGPGDETAKALTFNRGTNPLGAKRILETGSDAGITNIAVY